MYKCMYVRNSTCTPLSKFYEEGCHANTDTVQAVVQLSHAHSSHSAYEATMTSHTLLAVAKLASVSSSSDTTKRCDLSCMLVI
jgi:hypothetical protein